MEKEPLGLLFNNLPYYSEDQINEVINNLNQEQVIFFITQGLLYSYNQGTFSMIESEIISKSLRNLKKIVEKEK